MKHNLLKSVIISVILLMGVSNAWAEPWLCRSTAGGKIATKTVGDKLNNGNEWNYEYTTNGGWSSATDIQVYVGTSTSSYTTVNAGWKSDDGDNKNVAANIGSVSFDKSGKWYAVGKYKSGNTTAYTTKKDEWTNNTTLSMGSNDEPYWEVTPPAVSSFSVSVSGYLSGTGTSNDPYVIQPGNSLQLTLSGNKAKTDANSTIQYNTAGTWNTTNSRTISNITSITKTSVTVKMRCYNSTASLSGTESSKTIYYRAQSFAVTISAGANGSVAPTGSQQVGSTNVTIKATANTGYKFKNWTKTGGVVIANANNATTTITATANGTVTANFEEDLTSTWHIVGDPTSIFKGTSTWAAHDDNMLKKTTGASTASKGSLTIDVKTLPANNDSYQFKVLNTNGTKWYGWSNETNNHFWVNKTITTGVYNTDNNNLYFIPNALGEYKFAVDWSSSNPSLTVTFPTAYTVTFGKGTGGSSVTAKYSNTSFNSGTKVQQGKTVTFTQSASTGYTFKEWNTKADGTGTKLSAEATYTHTVTTSNNVYAVYTQNPDRIIYLEPTGFWDSNNPKYVAHVWGAGEEDITMTGVGEAPYRYYTCEVPAKYTNILFYRKSTNGSTIWNQTADLKIPTDNKTLYEIKSTGDGTTTKATGTWKAANLVYTITLNFCDFGTYGIKYNGQSFFSKPNENVTIDLPAGAEIEVLAGQPYNEAYTGDVYILSPTVKDVAAGEKITITGNITFEDNFITKESHVVYLGVPNTLAAWNVKENNIWYYIWRFTTKGDIKMVEELDRGKLAFEANGIKYYEFTISAGCNKIMFQHKQSAPTTTRESSVSLLYGIPLTEVNCFTLDGNENGNGYFTGSWNVLPAREGDYRLLYIEQKVGLKNGHPETTVTKAHPSDIIRQGDTRDTYSLHIYNKVVDGENGMNDPEILVQECTGYNGVNPIWTTRERHMVFGPLHADFGMAAMPGRRDAAGDPDAVLRYDNGIENIKNDDHADNGSGVWNFIVTRDGSNNFEALDLTQTARYEGDYYVRTDCADGGWDRYTLNGNHMTRSDISKRNSNYSHYFCKWIGEADVNVKYTIANDYGYAISDTLTADETDIWGTPIADAQKIVTGETLPTNNEYGGANIRFSWNEKSNFLHRAYLAGSTDVSSRFLVLEGQSGQLYDAKGQELTQGANGSDRYGLKANEEIFTDISNWVYYADVQLVPNAGLKLTAKYMDKVQYFIGQADIYSNTILQGTDCTQKYLIRLLYDFKINELVSAYVPGGNNDIEAIQTNLMLIRKGNNDASQLNFNTNNMKEEGQTAYGVIEFPYELLNDGSKDIYQRSLYWISFPFDVNLQDAFGVGQYGVHWLIQEYDGARRAEEGLWAESDSFWKLHWDQNITLKAGFGYVIELDISKICTDFEATFNEAGDCIAIYFPSAQPISGDIVKYPENNDVSITIPAHQCTIPIRDTPYGNRQIRDSHWNVIGVPSYVNAGADFSHSVYTRPEERKLKFYYKWITYDNYVVADANNDNTYNDNFQSMFAYMVQYEGNLTWKSVVNEKTPQGLAARQNSDTQKEHNLRLELQQNGAELDRTFITLQEDDVTAAFDFNYDLCKVNNGGANIYSLIATDTYPIQVAGNVLPVENNVIPVGVIIRTAGEYTFAMPEGTDGIVVELIDYQANTTTNLLFNDYTVSLPKGTFDNRFALSVKPDKTATSLENIFNKATGDEVKKYIIDGVLYMQKDGVLYDAQGHIVR